MRWQVAELLDRLIDTRAGVLADIPGFVDDARHGHRRDARSTSDVVQGSHSIAAFIGRGRTVSTAQLASARIRRMAETDGPPALRQVASLLYSGRLPDGRAMCEGLPSTSGAKGGGQPTAPPAPDLNFSKSIDIGLPDNDIIPPIGGVISLTHPIWWAESNDKPLLAGGW